MVKHTGRHPTRCALLGAGLLACALGPASAARAREVLADGVLSPRLAELARPAVRSGSPAEQAKAIGVASEGPGSLIREGGRVVVEVRFGSGTLARLGGLRAAGGRVLAASRRLQTATVSIAPAALHELAAVGGVDEVGETRAPILYGGSSAAAVGAECEGGSVVSEGVTQLHAAEARSKYGVDGAGVTVGVLSDSYNQATQSADESGPVATHAAEDVASGDLPGPTNPCAGEKTPVKVISDDFKGAEEAPATDEGRAMAQIVHDVAPGASLAFATAFDGESAFAQNIEKLAKPVGEGGAGAKVIVDDVAYFEEPFFQDGPIAAAVGKVAGEGVTYFSAAGNDNLFDAGGHEIASWEAPSFRDSSTCPATLLALPGFGGGHCMDFNPGAPTDDTFGITVAKGEVLTVDLQWAEPWHGDHTDLDAYLLDSKGNLLAEATSDNVGGTERPVEILQWENTGNSSKEVQLAVNRCSGSCNHAASGTTTPRLKLALLENGAGVTETEYPVSGGGDTVGPAIFGHSGAAGAVSVGAVSYKEGPHPSQPERYSSRGPVTHYFGPVGSGNSPAPELGAPEVLAKPDVAATDCGATTFFAFFVETTWRFCGTSAAAPHAAGVAALELQAKPGATPAEVRGAQTATAVPVGTFGPEAVGAGLLDADAAVAKLLPPPVVTITSHPPNRTADSTPTFEFTTNRPETTCSIDGGLAQPCLSPYPAAPLADGPHAFKVNALTGGTVEGSASFSFTVDTTAPTISFAGQPTILAEAAPSLHFSASEPASFTCAVDGGAAQACNSPFKVPTALSDGAHTLAVTATDQVGNSSHADLSFTVDTTAPTVTFSARPAAETRDSRPTLSFSASEPATLGCSLDEAPPQPCDRSFVAGRLTDGPHMLEVTATDPAGNVGSATASFVVDTVPPRTFFAFRPPKNVRTRLARVRLVLRFGSNEEGVTYVCRIDSGLLRFCPEVLLRRFPPGTHVVRVKAVDQAGNVDHTAAVYRFRVRRVGSGR
jgi:hypothetical protein